MLASSIIDRTLSDSFPAGRPSGKQLQSLDHLGRFYSNRSRIEAKWAPLLPFTGNDYEGLVCAYFELIAGQDEYFFQRRPLDFECPVARRTLSGCWSDFVRTDNISPAAVSDFDEIRSYTYVLDNDGLLRADGRISWRVSGSRTRKRKLDRLKGAPCPTLRATAPSPCLAAGT